VPPQLSSTPAVKRSASVLRELDNGRAWKDRSLFQRYVDERDPVDRQLLIERFLPLARQLAGRYRRAAEPVDDLFQVACVGLIKAIDRFDLEREIAFSTFAVPTILGELRRYFRDRTWSVRVPRELQERSLKVDRAVTDLTLALQRAPTVAEIAASVAAEEAEVLEALHAAGAYRAISLDAPRGNGGDDCDDTLGDTLSADDNRFERAEDRATLARLARRITPREREILRLRFAEDLTQAEIGERIGLSQMVGAGDRRAVGPASDARSVGASCATDAAGTSRVPGRAGRSHHGPRDRRPQRSAALSPASRRSCVRPRRSHARTPRA
jgi:RNA polymerase sigma-B factor